MSENLVELATSRDARLSRTPDPHPLVAEIVEALMALSGEAHREVVVDRIAQGRHRAARAASPALRDEVFRAFDAHRHVDGEHPSLFHLRFGEGSHRWSLAPAAIAFIDARGEMC
ncbi:hypothetical protein [Phenylobacterium aquaticum]|uniref:hypothetical protein n=1 Tax=Phenylobacterium aquaticum TaxID=1763816 RepID=UPI0026F14C6B|nr:hypothetical protein [Phenylobacterium aquaticum]